MIFTKRGVSAASLLAAQYPPAGVIVAMPPCTTAADSFLSVTVIRAARRFLLDSWILVIVAAGHFAQGSMAVAAVRLGRFATRSIASLWQEGSGAPP